MKRLLQLSLLVILLSGSVGALAYAGLPYIPIDLTAMQLNSDLYGEPQADFEGDPTAGVRPLDVSFTNLTSGVYDTCFWDFGDGNSSTECEPQNLFSARGVYSVTLMVSGTAGADSLTKANYVTVYEPISADFTGTPTSGVSSLEVSFSNTSTGDYDTCAWDFGDGATSNLCQEVGHTFGSPGVYTVTLTASNPFDADTRTREEYITVYEPPQAEFSATPLVGRLPLTVIFTDESTGDYDSCAWDFGDTGTGNQCDTQHTYFSSGFYTVTLTVSGPGGSDTKIRPEYIEVQRTLWYLPFIIRQ